jgi:hypothetical protein
MRCSAALKFRSKDNAAAFCPDWLRTSSIDRVATCRSMSSKMPYFNRMLLENRAQGGVAERKNAVV